MVVQHFNGNCSSLLCHWPFFRGEGRKEAPEFSLLYRKARWLGLCQFPLHGQVSASLRHIAKGMVWGMGIRWGALYLECCKAKVHFLYVAYSKRIERSICLHMVTVIWIWGSLSPVGHWCSRLMILQKADLSETLKVPVHFGGWAVMTLPKTESTPLRRTGWGFLISPFLLFMVRSSDVWQGNLGLTPGSRNGLSRTRVTSWKHSCTSRSEGVCGKQGEALKGCLEEGVGVVCRSHWKLSSSGVHGDQSWYPAIDSLKERNQNMEFP